MIASVEEILCSKPRKFISSDTIRFIEKFFSCENIIGLSVIKVERKMWHPTLFLSGRFLYFNNGVVELQDYVRKNDIFPQKLIIIPEVKVELPYLKHHVNLELYFHKA